MATTTLAEPLKAQHKSLKEKGKARNAKVDIPALRADC